MLDAIFSLSTLWWLILMLYVPSCIGLVIVVLLQKGKGVGFAGAFGAGPGSEAVFGPRSARSLPQKITYTMAGLFMFLALIMSMLSGKVGRGVAPGMIDEEGVATSASMDALFSGESTALPAGEIATPGDVTPMITVDGPGDTPMPAEAAPGAPAMEVTPGEMPDAGDVPSVDAGGAQPTPVTTVNAVPLNTGDAGSSAPVEPEAVPAEEAPAAP